MPRPGTTPQITLSLPLRRPLCAISSSRAARTRINPWVGIIVSLFMRRSFAQRPQSSPNGWPEKFTLWWYSRKYIVGSHRATFMKRRATTGGSGGKARRRTNSRDTSRRAPSSADLQKQPDEQTRELAEARRQLAEALEQQTATSEVLKVISTSPGELEPVFNAILENATRICEAEFAEIALVENNVMRVAAGYGDAPRLPPSEMVPLDRTTVMGRSICDQKPVHVADLQNAGNEFARGRELAKKYGHHTILCVPLIREDRALGTISVRRMEVRPFEQKHIAVLKTFAYQAAIAIENVRLFKAEQQRTRELSESLEQQTATSEVLKAFSSSPGELEPVFKAILKNATKLCGAGYGTMWLTEGEGFRAAARHGSLPVVSTEGGWTGTYFQPRSDIPLARCARTRTAVHVTDMREEQSYLDGDPWIVSGVDEAGVRSLLAVPMLKDNEPVGAIGIYRTQVRSFSDNQIELVTNFAAQAVIAIENARLVSELRARTGELTQSVGELRALGEISQVVNSTLDLQTVLDTIVANAAQISGTEAGAI